MMTNIDVKIVRLEPMLMASAYGFGQSPEGEAWEKMIAFATSRDMAIAGKPLGTYGFNNPNPSKGSPNYGYEIWLPLNPSEADTELEGDIRMHKFEGGLYAVTQFKGLENIGEVWRQLARWREGSQYQPGHHQWLEELLTPADVPLDEYVFNLYLPILE
jgi:effector-binding domain-containing protein